MQSGSKFQLPSGFRFKPTDDELIEHYLKKKAYDEPLSPGVVVDDDDVYAIEPWNLSGAQGDATEYYCFTRRKKKNKGGVRAVRTAGNGYWKVTGRERNVIGSRNQTIGFKRTLVFTNKKDCPTMKRCATKRKNWIMHEYRLNGDAPKHTEEWVLCRIKESNRSFEGLEDNTQEEEEITIAQPNSGADVIFPAPEEYSDMWSATLSEELIYGHFPDPIPTPTSKLASTSAQMPIWTNFYEDHPVPTSKLASTSAQMPIWTNFYEDHPVPTSNLFCDFDYDFLGQDGFL